MSSDNGGLSSGLESNGGSNFPLRGGKGALWEGATRASAFIWSPLLYQKNRVSDQMMHITDWLPTLYATARNSRPYRDLDIAMAQSKAARVLRNFHNKGILFMDSNWRTKAGICCDDDARGNFVPGAPPYLFDLEKDPCEMYNIALKEPGVSARQ
ncbi:hypothetical protein HPB47_018562 [Ixodes persulcatus]|uniref:Uncharacterized protein n=1 Tax=Ixodes persulcatus TaxID=34615 RepID=A0AC60QP21_IXOPE|nr:hypothetical protein HPB47_018562 [Ixodes persulcatus]